MSPDAELDLFRHSVNCAAVLEHLAGGWTLDKRQSTRRALKYRRGAGEIMIVNHDGRGWWDPTSTAKGDVFDLVQRLDPSLNFGQVRQVLRRYVGMVPSFSSSTRERQRPQPDLTPAERWAKRPRLRRGDPAWSYLAGLRAIPEWLLELAASEDAVRSGAYGSAWFAHRLQQAVSHVEVRGPNFKGSLAGGHKTLFRFGGSGRDFHRLAVLEAPIDALSLAALEQIPVGTSYLATGGGMGTGTLEALQEALGQLRATADGVLVSCADANTAGDRYATQHEGLAVHAGVAFQRLRPPDGQDWNDVLRERREGRPPSDSP
jgi:hypothetical protein